MRVWMIYNKSNRALMEVAFETRALAVEYMNKHLPGDNVQLQEINVLNYVP